MKNLVIIVLIIAGGWWLLSSDNKSSSPSYSSSSYSREDSMDRSDAISDYWDEIAEYIDGSYTVTACSDNSGNCYSLDAEIDEGEVSTLNFSNGGYVSLYGADIDSDGDASGCDEDDCWNIEVDESDIDTAIDDWADYKGVNLI